MLSMYEIEPFSVVRWANQYDAKGILFLSHFLKTYPQHIRGVVRSYNMDDQFQLYGSQNPGILAVTYCNLPLLKLMLKHGLDPLWKNHKGENMLYCLANSNDPALYINWDSRDSLSIKNQKKYLEKKEKMIQFLIQHPSFKAMMKQKSWSGTDAWECIEPKFQKEQRDFLKNHGEDHDYTQTLKRWILDIEKAVLTQSIEIPTAVSSAKKRKI